MHSLSIRYQSHLFMSWFSCRYGSNSEPVYMIFALSLFNNYLVISANAYIINIPRNYSGSCIGSALNVHKGTHNADSIIESKIIYYLE